MFNNKLNGIKRVGKKTILFLVIKLKENVNILFSLT